MSKVRCILTSRETDNRYVYFSQSEIHIDNVNFGIDSTFEKLFFINCDFYDRGKKITPSKGMSKLLFC